MLIHTPNNTEPKVLPMHPFRSLSCLFAAIMLSTFSVAVIAADTEAPTAEQPVSPEAPTAATNPEAPAPTDSVAQDAASPEPQHAQAEHMAEPTDETHKKVFDAFRKRFPALSIDSLEDGPYPGLYEIITDAQIVYVDEGVTLLFQGEMINLADGVNLTEARLAGIHMGLINELGEENMLVYKGANDSDRSITVFTDINCGYCRLLHSEIDTLLQAGISVRYLMFPRAGLESESRTALESVWCAEDPQEAMTAAKAGQPIEEKACDTPIETHYSLAGQVGLRGTPLIYLDNGTALPGYREASVIVEMINTSEPMAN